MEGDKITPSFLGWKQEKNTEMSGSSVRWKGDSANNGEIAGEKKQRDREKREREKYIERE